LCTQAIFQATTLQVARPERENRGPSVADRPLEPNADRLQSVSQRSVALIQQRLARICAEQQRRQILCQAIVQITRQPVTFGS
jgi:hypothetical protein